MRHLGDITKISGFTAPVVDIITGGSPCQDLSIAGKREGLKKKCHNYRTCGFETDANSELNICPLCGSYLDLTRSGLFVDQIRIIKEMRENEKRSGRSADAIRPRYMVWENVPGAFSSNKGEDFRAVLEETARIAKEDAIIPGLEGGRNGDQPDVSWETDGALLGEYTMRSFGEYPSEERESLLSQILEDKPHQKYSLSAKACQGILRRAKNRGKELPEILAKTLQKQSDLMDGRA